MEWTSNGPGSNLEGGLVRGGRSGRRDRFSSPATNLQVLKVDNPEDLRPIMQNFTRSLNVNCRFCHDTQDFAKDVPHKETARRMIEMVNQINTQVFTWERAPRATCNMCHNGSPTRSSTRRSRARPAPCATADERRSDLWIWPHVHLLLNHVPVMGVPFGFLLLDVALARKAQS